MYVTSICKVIFSHTPMLTNDDRSLPVSSYWLLVAGGGALTTYCAHMMVIHKIVRLLCLKSVEAHDHLWRPKRGRPCSSKIKSSSSSLKRNPSLCLPVSSPGAPAGPGTQLAGTGLAFSIHSFGDNEL